MSNTLATWCKELTHWKRSWCWERLKAGWEGDDRGWDGCMASLTRLTWVWVSSGSWWWPGKAGELQSMWSQRVRHNWGTELNWIEMMSLQNGKGSLGQKTPKQKSACFNIFFLNNWMGKICVWHWQAFEVTGLISSKEINNPRSNTQIPPLTHSNQFSQSVMSDSLPQGQRLWVQQIWV